MRYRIQPKSGELKYIEDFGHLLHWMNGKSFFYVFIVDVDQNEFLSLFSNTEMREDDRLTYDSFLCACEKGKSFLLEQEEVMDVDYTRDDE